MEKKSQAEEDELRKNERKQLMRQKENQKRVESPKSGVDSEQRWQHEKGWAKSVHYTQ